MGYQWCFHRGVARDAMVEQWILNAQQETSSELTGRPGLADVMMWDDVG